MILTVKRLFDAFREYPDELRVCRKGEIDILYSDHLSMEAFAYNNADREVEDFMIGFEDGILILEITRLCTDGTHNACSMLYGACARVAKDMGYLKIITYILESENGASLKASGFVCEGKAGGVKWTGERNLGQDIPHEMKTRWAKRFLKEEEK